MQKYVYWHYKGRPDEEKLEKLEFRLQELVKDTIVRTISSHYHWIATEA